MNFNRKYTVSKSYDISTKSAVKLTSETERDKLDYVQREK